MELTTIIQKLHNERAKLDQVINRPIVWRLRIQILTKPGHVGAIIVTRLIGPIAARAEKQLVPAEQARDETLKRAKAIKEAGASGLFVPGIAAADEIKAVAAACGLPLNVMARPGAPKAAELKALGAKRVSAATSIYNAAMAAATDAAREFLAEGDSEKLWARRGAPVDYNKLFQA